MNDIEVTLTIVFPGEYFDTVYNGQVSDSIITEEMAEYFGSVDLYDLSYSWKEI